MERSANPPIQTTLLQAIAAQLPAHLSLADELADILQVSRDSAYRRIRGETELSLREAHLLSVHFSLSLDTILQTKTDTVVFFNPDADAADIEGKLQQVHENLGLLEGVSDRELIYFSMELPVFHVLQVPILLSFKMHYWNAVAQGGTSLPRIILADTPLSGRPLELVNRYIRIPSTEIISEASLASTLRQVLYFMEAGAFTPMEEGIRVLEAVGDLIHHLRKQAALGRKFLFGAKPAEEGPTDQFKLFHNEMIYSQNIAYLRANSLERTFLEHNITHFLHTDDPHFCAATYGTLQTILQRSTPISSVAERERNKFFNRLDANVAQAKERAKAIMENA